VKPNLAPKTFERYKQLVRVNINPKLGPIKLAKLQPVQIAEFYTWSSTAGNRRTGAGLSARTVLHIFAEESLLATFPMLLKNQSSCAINQAVSQLNR
jgi:hypothetical protein